MSKPISPLSPTLAEKTRRTNSALLAQKSQESTSSDYTYFDTLPANQLLDITKSIDDEKSMHRNPKTIRAVLNALSIIQSSASNENKPIIHKAIEKCKKTLDSLKQASPNNQTSMRTNVKLHLLG
jgi:hypothetical protein